MTTQAPLPAPLRDLYNFATSSEKKVTLDNEKMSRQKALALTVTRIFFAAIALAAITSGVVATAPLAILAGVISLPATAIAAGSYLIYAGAALMTHSIATSVLAECAMGLAAIGVGSFFVQCYSNYTFINIGETPITWCFA